MYLMYLMYLMCLMCLTMLTHTLSSMLLYTQDELLIKIKMKYII